MSAFKGFLGEVIGPDGMIVPARLSAALNITRGDLAVIFGLSRDAVSKSDRLEARITQSRLREGAEVINRVLPWCGSVARALAWYCSEPLPAFGDLTAAELVRQDRAAHVMSYLSGLALGGYA